jgi:hypothetical protein
MLTKHFVATLNEENVVIVQTAEDLPEMIHAIFYRENFEVFLDGHGVWTAEAETVAMKLIDALAAETSIEF